MSRSLKVGALVASLTVLIVVAAMQRGRTLRATRALRTLPSTTRIVVRVDARELPSSPAARALLGGLLPPESLSEIEAVCGFDPLRDLNEITLWVRGAEQLESFGLMMTGAKVDATKLAECHRTLVASRGGEVVRIEAPTGPVLASDDRRSAVAIIDDRTVVTGSVETVAETMAVARGLLPSLEERASVAGLWKEIAPRAAIVAVVEPPEHWKAAFARVGGGDEDHGALEDVEALGLAVGRELGSEAEARARAFTVAGAERVAATIADWVATPPQGLEPPWDTVLRTGEVTRDGNDVALRVDVSSLAEPR